MSQSLAEIKKPRGERESDIPCKLAGIERESSSDENCEPINDQTEEVEFRCS